MSENLVQAKVRIDPENVAWFKANAKANERAFSWMINHALTLYRTKIEADRERRKPKTKSGKSA